MEVKPRSKEGPVHNTHNNQRRQSSSRRPSRHFTSAAAYGQNGRMPSLDGKIGRHQGGQCKNSKESNADAGKLR